MQEDFNPFVPNVRFEKIPIRMLVSNQDYQRNLSQSHVTRTADNFDLYQINPVRGSFKEARPEESFVNTHSQNEYTNFASYFTQFQNMTSIEVKSDV